MSTFVGYSDKEARISLRACSNNIDEAITFILDRRQTMEEARQKAKKERRVQKELAKTTNTAFANVRSVLRLSEHGFDKNLAALALQKTDNDLEKAVSTFIAFRIIENICICI